MRLRSASATASFAAGLSLAVSLLLGQPAQLLAQDPQPEAPKTWRDRWKQAVDGMKKAADSVRKTFDQWRERGEKLLKDLDALRQKLQLPDDAKKAFEQFNELRRQLGEAMEQGGPTAELTEQLQRALDQAEQQFGANLNDEQREQLHQLLEQFRSSLGQAGPSDPERQATAMQDVKLLHGAVEKFVATLEMVGKPNRLPTSFDELVTGPADWDARKDGVWQPLIPRVPTDPWARPYRLEILNSEKAEFRVRCLGKDGKHGGSGTFEQDLTWPDETVPRRDESQDH